MDSRDVQRLLDYHYWARDRLLDAVEALPPEAFTRDMKSSFRSVRDTLAHLLSAEWAWCERWHGSSPTSPLPPERFPDVESLRTAWVENEGRVRTFVAGLGEEGMTRTFEYRMLNGTQASSMFCDMVQHVVNHGSYHRGQVTTLLRQLGAAPPRSMDLVAFQRERG
jgi:uncharacterized damage-inducible protein DinB